MKKHFNLVLMSLLGLLIMTGACSNEAYDELPGSVSSFLAQYFPGLKVKDYTKLSDDSQIIQLSGGPTLIFDAEDQWTEIDGNGSMLPQVLMFDQLPPQLYDYLQSIEQQSDVIAVKRDNYYYKLTMSDTVITYDISTGDITYPQAAPDN